mgnify:CR=1 FL=1
MFMRTLFSLILIGVASSLVFLLATNSDEKSYSEIIFLVEPQCNTTVESYFQDLEKSHEIEVNLLEINSNKHIYSSIKYVGIMSSQFADSGLLLAMINGALLNCSTNSKKIFDSTLDSNLEDFISYVKFIENYNPDGTLIIENVNKQLVIHEKYD